MAREHVASHRAARKRRAAIGLRSGQKPATRRPQAAGLATLQQQIGNRALQRALAGVSGAAAQGQAAASTPTSPLVPEIVEKLAPWLRDRPGAPGTLSRNPSLRNVLLTMYARLGTDLWALIPPGGITWVSERGELNFRPRDDETVRRALLGRGYSDSYFAKRSEDKWGLREPNLPAAGLHWRGGKGGVVNVHIDLHPPSWTGFWHWFQDAYRRSRTHDPETLRAGVESLGLYIPVLFEQKLHGAITGKLDHAASRSQLGAGAMANLNEGRQALQQAAAIIWNRPTVTQEELGKALSYLARAARCAEVLERSRREMR